MMSLRQQKPFWPILLPVKMRFDVKEENGYG
jgi:hypothetical protein